MSLASDSSETVEVIIVNLDRVTASGMGIHHVVLTLTRPAYNEGHRDLNHENNKCLIISETIQAMPTTFAVKIV